MSEESKRWARAVAVWFVTFIVGALAAKYGLPAPPPLVVERVTEKTVVAGVEQPAAEKMVDFGWVPPSPEDIAAALDPWQTDQFAATPAGRAVMGDDDVFLWRALAGVGIRAPPWVNQKDVGCCVGCGFAHGCDVSLAVQVQRDPTLEWRKISVEAIYAGSRNEAGGGRIRGDGSVGAWAADFVGRIGGAAPAEKYQTVDLTEFSPSRARSMGQSGARLPADVLAAAKKNPAKGTALVRTWEDVARAVRQGYPVAVCSNVGFAGMTRDQQGFVKASGSWAHCMVFIGVRGGNRPGAYCLNSWGESAHPGPVWPSDAPVNGFWVDAATVDRMVRQTDSYAISDQTGFPTRKLPDWFIRVQPRQWPGFGVRFAAQDKHKPAAVVGEPALAF